MRNHKSLLAWQRAHFVAMAVMDACEGHWRPSAAAAFNQLQKSALSVQLNIAEGYALGTPAYFRRHLVIAYGSAVETSDLLEILRERKIVPAEQITPAMLAARESQALIMGLLRKGRRN